MAQAGLFIGGRTLLCSGLWIAHKECVAILTGLHKNYGPVLCVGFRFFSSVLLSCTFHQFQHIKLKHSSYIN